MSKLYIENTLIIGVSSRALFNLEKENQIFESGRFEEYRKYQIEKENEVLEKGTAFHLVEALLKLNSYSDERLVEVIIMSRNSPDTGLRILNSVKHYNLDITRSVFLGGESQAHYLKAFQVDLLLTRNQTDIQTAIDSKDCAVGILYDPPESYLPDQEKIKLAFDGDAVLFSDASEVIYQKEGLEQFQKNEREKENIELAEGPFAKLIKVLSRINNQIGAEKSPLKLSLITARNAPAHLRVITTLRKWGVHLDQAFFLGGISKEKILATLKPHIFFDDKKVESYSKVAPTGKVAYESDSELKKKGLGQT